MAQRQIVFNTDTQAIFLDIMPLVKSIYTHYFDAEITNIKGSVKKSDSELIERSFESCLTFCKEFSFMPYMCSKRVVAFIWHTVAYCGRDDPSIKSKGTCQELCNNPDQTNVISNSMNMGRTFTMA